MVLICCRCPENDLFSGFFLAANQVLIIQQPLKASLFAPQDFSLRGFFIGIYLKKIERFAF